MSKVLYCSICGKQAIGKPAGCVEHGFLPVAPKPFIERKVSYEELKDRIAALEAEQVEFRADRKELNERYDEMTHKYELRIQALEAENEELKAQLHADNIGYDRFELGKKRGKRESAEFIKELIKDGHGNKYGWHIIAAINEYIKEG